MPETTHDAELRKLRERIREAEAQGAVIRRAGASDPWFAQEDLADATFYHEHRAQIQEAIRHGRIIPSVSPGVPPGLPTRKDRPVTINDLFPDTQGQPTIGQLAEKFADMLEDVRSCEGPLYGRSLTAEALLTAPAATRTAYLRLAELSEVHAILRLAQAAHRRLPSGAAVRDADPPFWSNPYDGWRSFVGSFFDSRRFPDITPGVVLPLPSNIARPGPAEPLARLLWLATDPDADPWLPSPEDQDIRFSEFRDEIARRRRAHAPDRMIRVPVRW